MAPETNRHPNLGVAIAIYGLTMAAEIHSSTAIINIWGGVAVKTYTYYLAQGAEMKGAAHRKPGKSWTQVGARLVGITVRFPGV